MDYQVHGGVNTFNGDIESLVAHDGVFYIYGNVGSMDQRGGVVYDHRQVKADRIQIVTDKMSDKERLRQHGIEMIERRGGDHTKDKRQKKTKH